MKKFVSGMIAGIGISACTIVFASPSLQAYLFPSKVTVHMDGAHSQLDLINNPVINYNNKAYIPLRAFSDAVNAEVTYSPPSSASDGKSAIDLYVSSESPGVTLEDTDGYVSVSRLSVIKDTDSITGILRVNKELSGRIIEIHAVGKDNTITGSTVILPPSKDSAPAANGEAITFTAPFYARGLADSYEVVVRDTWGVMYTEGFHDGFLTDVAGLVFGRPAVNEGVRGIAPVLEFKNGSKDDIVIDPLQVEYEVVRIDSGKEEVIYSRRLPLLQGLLPAESIYSAKLPVWDFKDKEGKTVKPGKYAVQIKAPSSLNFSYKSSGETQTIEKLSRYTRWEYDLTARQINDGF
ncbi:hypothetical protein [Paenibacillus sp. FJAT-26967]|uniref:hypothetical protein n=1 Tax=Paenibacillus sp. FJAT-26967 TaxID=1729690 RepID=UPI000837E6ED|nr:hypothetical protein [Paenibacillus sp. FJAT-26967]